MEVAKKDTPTCFEEKRGSTKISEYLTAQKLEAQINNEGYRTDVTYIEKLKI